MLWLIVGLVLSIVLAVACAYLPGDWGIPGVILFAVATFVLGLLLLIVGLSRHYGRIGCGNFERQTGYQTRFVIYTTFDTGDCLVRQKDGKWIPKSQLRDFSSR